jgi:hypothetical protein
MAGLTGQQSSSRRGQQLESQICALLLIKLACEWGLAQRLWSGFLTPDHPSSKLISQHSPPQDPLCGPLSRDVFSRLLPHPVKTVCGTDRSEAPVWGVTAGLDLGLVWTGHSSWSGRSGTCGPLLPSLGRHQEESEEGLGSSGPPCSLLGERTRFLNVTNRL